MGDPGLGLRRPSFAQFGDVSGAIRDVLGGGDPNPMSLDHRARKRRDAEDDSPKSSGNIGAVFIFISCTLHTCYSLFFLNLSFYDWSETVPFYIRNGTQQCFGCLLGVNFYSIQSNL